MVKYEELYVKALLKLYEVYGIDYLKDKISDSFVSKYVRENDVMFYFCFESEEERPNLQPNKKGWTVYATVSVEINTGNVNIIDCVLPSGEQYKNS